MDLIHLARRFFSYRAANELSAIEHAQVAGWIRETALQELFFAQPTEDQRHGFDAALWVQARDSRPWMVQCGLLHDVAKRHASLGRWGRALATAAQWFSVVPTTRSGLYNAHGDRGAQELADAGADARVVAYTANHHGRRPQELSSQDWELLDQADRRN